MKGTLRERAEPSDPFRSETDGAEWPDDRMGSRQVPMLGWRFGRRITWPLSWAGRRIAQDSLRGPGL